MSYEGINNPVSIDKIVCSTLHIEDAVSIEDVRLYIEEIIRDEIQEYDLSNTEFLIILQEDLLLAVLMETQELQEERLLLILMVDMHPMVAVLLVVKIAQRLIEVRLTWLDILLKML